MIDLIGNKLTVGDKVATSVLSYKRDRCVVGVVTSINETGGVLTVSPIEGGDLHRSITRRPAHTVKVAQ